MDSAARLSSLSLTLPPLSCDLPPPPVHNNPSPPPQDYRNTVEGVKDASTDLFLFATGAAGAASGGGADLFASTTNGNDDDDDDALLLLRMDMASFDVNTNGAEGIGIDAEHFSPEAYAW